MSSADLQVLWREARKLGRRRRGAKAPPLLFFTDPARTPDPVAVVERLPRGCGVVLRTFGAAEAVRLGPDLARQARRRGVRLIVGADAALARALGADGVHLPERMSRRRGWIAALRRRFLVTAAVHGEAAIRAAQRSEIDALVLSAVFPSQSPSAGRPIGPRRFAALARLATPPVIALGGVNSRTVRRLRGSGAAGVACVSGIKEATGGQGGGPRT